MLRLDGKWEGMEEVNKPKLLIGVPCLRGDILALGRLIKYQLTPQRQLRAQRQEVSYLMGDTRVIGLVSVLWGKGRRILESGWFTPL